MVDNVVIGLFSMKSTMLNVSMIKLSRSLSWLLLLIALSDSIKRVDDTMDPHRNISRP